MATAATIKLGVSQRFPAVGLTKQIMEKTLRRNDYTCQSCGFVSRRFQRVISAAALGKGSGGSKRGKSKEENFITVCRFCELSLCLDVAGSTGGGILIWLPEISQADLNSIVRAAYIAKSEPDASSGKLAEAATRALDALMARRAEAKKRLGSDDPLLLATVMAENLSDEEYAASAAKLEGIRLLPQEHWPVHSRTGKHDQFANMVRYWKSAEGPYSKFPVSKWMDLFASAGNP